MLLKDDLRHLFKQLKLVIARIEKLFASSSPPKLLLLKVELGDIFNKGFKDSETLFNLYRQAQKTL